MRPPRSPHRTPLVGLTGLLASLTQLAQPGCGGAPLPAAPVAAPPAHPARVEPGLAIYPMRLVGTGETRGALAWIHLEIEADGTLRWRGERAGRLADGRLEDLGGHVLLSVARDGSVALAEGERDVQLRADGVLEIDGNTERVYFDDHDRVVATRFGHAPGYLGLRLEGLRPDAVRTGALLVLYAMMRTGRL